MTWVALSAIYQKLGRAQQAAESLEKAREYIQDESEYNKACYEAIVGNTDVALEHLTLALAQNPALRPWATRDPDLASLRGKPRFEELTRTPPTATS